MFSKLILLLGFPSAGSCAVPSVRPVRSLHLAHFEIPLFSL